MEEMFSRTAMLIGEESVAKLSGAHIAVFGLGGVGGHALEALVRAGVGAVDIIDADTVSVSNLNRQIIATRETVGQYKTDAFEKRILSINPDCKVEKMTLFVTKENIDDIDLKKYDYVIDAIDTVSAKIALAVRCESLGVSLISSMGTGNKLDPSAFEISDIYKTSVCPLARVMRTELKKRGVKSLKVLYSKEEPRKPAKQDKGEEPSARRATPASISFVPSVAGLIIASAVIKDIIGEN